MKPVHDPLATAETCEACKTDPGGYDHEAVRRARPRDFDQQVKDLVARRFRLSDLTSPKGPKR